MGKKDRMLLLKFMSGDSRIRQNTFYSIRFRDDCSSPFPEGHTCSLFMYLPYYRSKEEMKKNMLIAFRMCGEIDLDGGSDMEYGDESGSDESDG
mmetsp:Transcript_134/g.116  ORF Transcript_134/g.116 Transcript_134/m.116 type:complete len:94 (+) Transcript_134:1109-1390(+)